MLQLLTGGFCTWKSTFRTQWPRQALLTSAIVFSLSNLYVERFNSVLKDSAFIYPAIALGAPVALIAAWSMLAIEAAWRADRSATCRLLVLGSFTAMVYGLIGFVFESLTWHVAVILPATVLLTSQLVPWAMRYCLKWRLHKAADVELSHDVWSLKQLLMGTCLVALSFAACRWSGYWVSPQLPIGLAIVIFLASTLILVPAACCILWPQQLGFAFAWGAAHFFGLEAALVLIPILALGREGALLSLYCAAVGILFFSASWIGMLALRLSGYRLIRFV